MRKLNKLPSFTRYTQQTRCLLLQPLDDSRLLQAYGRRCYGNSSRAAASITTSSGPTTARAWHLGVGNGRSFAISGTPTGNSTTTTTATTTLTTAPSTSSKSLDTTRTGLGTTATTRLSMTVDENFLTSYDCVNI